jgi:hypothetical protein
VERLRDEADGDGAVKHDGTGLGEELGLNEVVAVHDHEDVLVRDVARSLNVRVHLVEDHVVDVGRLAVQLMRERLAVTDPDHVAEALCRSEGC